MVRHSGTEEVAEGCPPLPLIGATPVTTYIHANPASEPVRQRRRREAPPLVGRDNSTTRYLAVKDCKLGVRRQRRWDNLLGLKQALKALGHDEDGQEEPLFQARHTALSALLRDRELMNLWETVSGDEQAVMTRLAHLHLDDPAVDTLAADSPLRRYLRVDRSIRLAMRRRHLPLGLLEHLEANVIDTFVADAAARMETRLEDSYSRMLQHGICQYLGLKSNSANVRGVRVTTITNPAASIGFATPEVLLSAILSHTVSAS